MCPGSIRNGTLKVGTYETSHFFGKYNMTDMEESNGKVFKACQPCPQHTISSINIMACEFNYVFPTSSPAASDLAYHDGPQESSLRWIPHQ